MDRSTWGPKTWKMIEEQAKKTGFDDDQKDAQVAFEKWMSDYLKIKEMNCSHSVDLQNSKICQKSNQECKLFNEEDVNIVMQQTNVSQDVAVKVLCRHNGDIVNAIMDIERI